MSLSVLSQPNHTQQNKKYVRVSLVYLQYIVKHKQAGGAGQLIAILLHIGKPGFSEKSCYYGKSTILSHFSTSCYC